MDLDINACQGWRHLNVFTLQCILGLLTGLLIVRTLYKSPSWLQRSRLDNHYSILIITIMLLIYVCNLDHHVHYNLGFTDQGWIFITLLIITIMLIIFGYCLNHHRHHHHGFTVRHNHHQNHLDHPHHPDDDNQGAAGDGLPVLDHLLPSRLLCTSLGRIWPQLVIVKKIIIIFEIALGPLRPPKPSFRPSETPWDPAPITKSRTGNCLHCIRELWFRSIRLAQKHCKDPSWIYIDTTPFYAMVRFSGGSSCIIMVLENSWWFLNGAHSVTSWIESNWELIM